MGQTLDNKALVIGVASSALFDLGESDQIFREEGVEAYERYQNEHLDEPFVLVSRSPSFRNCLSSIRSSTAMTRVWRWWCCRATVRAPGCV